MSRFIARFAALSALLLLVPVTLQAQGQGQGGMMGGQGGAHMLQMLLTSPAGFALENRADLELTEEQAPRLQALHDAYEEKNEAHLEILRARAEAMGAMQGEGQRQGMQGQGERQGMQGQGRQGMQGQGRQGMQGQGRQGQRGQGAGAMGGDMAEMQGAMQAVREARQAQLEAVGDILSANQLRQLREMMMPRNPGEPGGPTTH